MRFLNKDRALLGIGVAPFTAPIVVTLLNGFFDPISFLVSYLVASTTFIIIGLPVVIWLDVKDRLTSLTLTISGAVGGFIVFLLFGLAAGSVIEVSWHAVSQILLWGSSVGLAVAWSFGLLTGINSTTNQGRL